MLCFCNACSTNNDITDCVYGVTHGTNEHSVKEEMVMMVFVQMCLDNTCVCGGENSKTDAGEVRLQQTSEGMAVWFGMMAVLVIHNGDFYNCN